MTIEMKVIEQLLKVKLVACESPCEDCIHFCQTFIAIFQVGRSVDETLRLVQAFQYTDKHGEVCPAGWKPGKETIIPDPTEKKKYFAKQPEKGEKEEK